jgi:hypothetical protein
MANKFTFDGYLNAVLMFGEVSALGMFTQLLRSHAKDSFGWPPHLANQLEVVHVNGGPTIAMPPELEDEMRKLNYGTPTQQFSPALSTFAMGIGVK